MPAKVNRKVNAPRQKWPKMFDEEGDFTEEYKAYTEDMSVCYDLVGIARGILSRPDLRLKAGGPRDGIARAATDGTIVFLPKMHPRRRIATKHELSHIYFKSNIQLRLAFVYALLGRMEKKSGRTLSAPVKEALVDDLCFLINIFDDIRVNSLWGLLYPGDGRDMEEWYHDEIGPQMMKRAENEYRDGDIDHLFTYAILLTLGQDAKSSKWEKFRDQIVQAGQEVHFKSFKACLLIVRDLLEGIIKEVAEKQEQEKQPSWGAPGSLDVDDESDLEPDPDALSDNQDIDDRVKDRSPDPGDDDSDLVEALTEMSKGSRPSDKFDNDNAGFDHKSEAARKAASPKDAEEIHKAVSQLLDIDLDDEDEVFNFVDQEEADQLGQVQSLQRSMDDIIRAQAKDQDGALTKNVKAQVNLINVKKADIVPYDLTPEELATAKKWKRHFLKVMGAMRKRVAPEGYELVPPLYIHQKLTGQPLICYRRPQTGRGFRLTVLIDLSGSMHGGKFRQAQKLYRVLQYALNFPFVHLDVMGFNSTEKGAVNIFRYPRNAEGLASSNAGPDGITPLSHAIQVAGQSMVGCKHQSYLFVLSDGMPVYRLANASGGGRRSFVHTNMLMNWTADAVRDLQRSKVSTYCFMVGRSLGYDIPKAESLDKMFGRPFWRHVSNGDMYAESFEFIRGRFLQYLRTR